MLNIQRIIDNKYNALLAPIDQSISKLNESIKSLTFEKENVSKSTESINKEIKDLEDLNGLKMLSVNVKMSKRMLGY